MTTTAAYIMGFAHGAVVCSVCALFGQWLARRTIAKAAPLPDSEGPAE